MASSFTSRARAREHGLATGHRLWFGFPVAAPSLPHVRGIAPERVPDLERRGHGPLADRPSRRRPLPRAPAALACRYRGAAPALGLATGFRDTKTYGSYAMGWFTGEKAGTTALHHGGSTPGYTTEMAILPDRRLGLVVLTNAFAQHHLGDGALALVLGRQPPPTRPTRPSAASGCWLALVQLVLLAGLLWRSSPLGVFPTRRPDRAGPAGGGWEHLVCQTRRCWCSSHGSSLAATCRCGSASSSSRRSRRCRSRALPSPPCGESPAPSGVRLSWRSGRPRYRPA